MKSNGFTLIEIMVVTLVVGLLATLGSIAVTRGVSKSRVNEASTELNMVSTAILQLAWDTGRWPNQRLRTSPGSAELWDLSSSSSGLMASNTTYTGWKGPYYDGEVLDPWGNPYFFDPDYRVGGVYRIVVGSFGPNGQGRNRYDNDDIYVFLDD